MQVIFFPLQSRQFPNTNYFSKINVQGDSGGKVNTLEGTVSVIVIKKIHMNMGIILNGYCDMAL